MRFLVLSAFPQLINRTALEIRLNWVALHYHLRRQKLAFRIHTPTPGVQIIVFEAHFRIRFPFLWRDSYVSWGLAGCELTNSHAKKHLRSGGAIFAYQVIVVR